MATTTELHTASTGQQIYSHVGEHASADVPTTLMTPNSSSYLSSTTVSQWLKALERFDQSKLKGALHIFMDIEPKTSKINYNIASIHATLGAHDLAISYFKLAIENDNYMAISHFQIGVCRFLSGLYRKAARSFNTALKLLRGNSVINYQQLGLEYKLYSCEIMYNRALSYFYSGQVTVGIYDLGFAVKEKRFIPEHSILDEALAHFSQSDEYLRSEVDIRSMLKLPTTADSRKQRFSLLAPPDYKIASGLSSNSGAASLNSDSSHSVNDTVDSAGQKKEMVYTLFSVPQGALFRLTETKVQYILGDKYMDAIASPAGALPVSKSSNKDGAQFAATSLAKTGVTIASSPSLRRPKTAQSAAAVPPRNSSKKSSLSSTVSAGGSHHYPKIEPKGMTVVQGNSKHAVPYDNSSSNSASSLHTPSNASSFTSIHTSISSSIDSTNNSASPESNLSVSTVTLANSNGISSDHSQLPLQTPVAPLARINRAKADQLQAVEEHAGEDTILPSDNDLRLPAAGPEDACPPAQVYPSGPISTTNKYHTKQNSFSSNSERLFSRNEESPHTTEVNKLAPAAKLASGPTVSMIAPPKGNPLHHPYSPASPESMTTSQFSSPESRRPLPVEHTTPNSSTTGSIKVKIHHAKETRVMIVNPGISFDQFRSRIASKLDGVSINASGAGNNSSVTGGGHSQKVDPELIYLRVKDEDGDLVLLGDQEDLDVALEELCAGQTRSGKQKFSVFVELMI